MGKSINSGSNSQGRYFRRVDAEAASQRKKEHFTTPKVLLRMTTELPEYYELEQLWVEIKMLEKRIRYGKKEAPGGIKLSDELKERVDRYRELRNVIAIKEREGLSERRGAHVANALLLVAYRLIREITVTEPGSGGIQFTERQKSLKNMIKLYLRECGEYVADPDDDDHHLHKIDDCGILAAGSENPAPGAHSDQ